MGIRKPGLSRERHEAIGAELFAIRNRLLTLGVEVGTAYPKNSRQYKAGMEATKSVDRLRNVLDDAVHAEHPHAKPEEWQAINSIYYPGSKP